MKKSKEETFILIRKNEQRRTQELFEATHVKFEKCLWEIIGWDRQQARDEICSFLQIPEEFLFSTPADDAPLFPGAVFTRAQIQKARAAK